MSPVITEETAFLIRSVVYGVFLGVFYGILHRLIDVLFRRMWWRGLEDLLYWTICALVLFSMIREDNGGTIRWYVLAGAAGGGWLYYGGIRPGIHRLFLPLWKFAGKIRESVENLLKK